MDKFTSLFYQFTDGACDYLRIKNVELVEATQVANVHMLVREDKYDNFDNKIIKQLEKFFKAIVKTYKVNFSFERLVVSEAIVREELIQQLLSTFPFVASNILLDTIEVEVDEDIHVTIYMPERVSDYAKDNDFAAKVAEFVQDRFMCKSFVNVELTDERVEETSLSTQPTLSNRIRATEVKYLAGTKSPEPSSATLIEGIKEKADNILVLGTVRNWQLTDYKKKQQEDEANGRHYEVSPELAKKRERYPYRYSFTLDDTTGSIRVMFNAKEPLKSLDPAPTMVIVRGRVFYSEGRGDYNVSARTIYSCKADFEALKEARKPLPVPDTYRTEPLPVEVKERVMQMRLDDEDFAPKRVLGTVVFGWVKSISNTKLIPYEMSFVKVEDGKPTCHYTTYVFNRDVLSIDARHKSYVTTAPRLGDIVPDLVKFLDKTLVVVFDANSLQALLSETAKPLRLKLEAEFWDANQLVKKSKDKTSFDKVLSQHGIIPQDDTSYEYAYSLYELYLDVKGA